MGVRITHVQRMESRIQKAEELLAKIGNLHAPMSFNQRQEVVRKLRGVQSALLSVRMPTRYKDFLEKSMQHLKWSFSFQNLLIRELEELLSGSSPKQNLAITTPPRHGKTTTITIPLPAYKMIYWPGSEVIAATHSQGLANFNSRHTRRIVQEHIGVSTENVQDWQAKNGSSYKCIGVGGYLPGRGGNLIVADDLTPSRKHAESPVFRESLRGWWESDLITRRNPGQPCPVIMITTRWHPEDLWTSVVNPETWKILRLPAICDYSADDPDEFCRIPDPLGRQPGDVLCPGLWDRNALEGIRAQISEYTWLSLYQGRPAWRDGLFFEVRKFDKRPYTEEIKRRVRFFDLAASDEPDACYTASVRMALGRDGRYIIEHIDRIQAGPAQRDAWQRRLAQQDHAKMGGKEEIAQVEELQPGAAGKDRARNFARLMSGFKHSVQAATGDKVTRADPYAAHVGAGLIHLPDRDCFGEDQKKRIADFMTEHSQFPLSSTKDYVDAGSGAFSYLNRRRLDMLTSRSLDNSAVDLTYPPGMWGRKPKGFHRSGRHL